MMLAVYGSGTVLYISYAAVVLEYAPGTIEVFSARCLSVYI